MEKKLKALFDYQRFEKNERLAKFIGETESRYAKELSDDELSLVNAAGEPAVSGGTISGNPVNAQSDEKNTGSAADGPNGYQTNGRMRP